jgi:glyoxylase-like metal-dependent hydrolase (beta-lactamase superfamily II)
MQQSLTKIAKTIPADTVVYPGHGPQTTIADELQYNPYLRS